MATNPVLPLSPRPHKGGQSLFNLSNQELLGEIYATHVHEEKNLNVESLFIVVGNVLERSAQIADKFVLGSQPAAEPMVQITPGLSFGPLFCTLKSISSVMQCQAAGEETAHKTALSILKILSNYSWDAKAVLTLAAFALDYGEFWQLYQTPSTDQLAESVGTLMGIPVLLGNQTPQKHKQELYELNKMVRDTVKMMECIFKLETLFNKYDPKEVPALSMARDNIPVDVFWAIVTVVASTTQFCCLTSDGKNKQQLSQFQQQLNKIRSKLESQIAEAEEKIDEIERYRMLQRIIRPPKEIIEALKALINVMDKVTLSEGPSGKPVEIDVLKGKNIFLFISRLDKLDSEIERLKKIYESKRTVDQYNIVWIPIVDQWTEELQKKFEILRAKMPWYVVPNFSSKSGIKFVKEEWHFTGKQQVVVLTPKTELKHENAMHMICVWGTEAFPFTMEREEELLCRSDWFWYIISSLYPKIEMKEEKYFFIYGGKDNEWIEKFSKKATGLADDQVMKDANISLELYCIGKNSKGEDDLGILRDFWSALESVFVCMTNKKTELDPLKQEIQKLLSYKSEHGWAVLFQGSKLLASCDGTTLLKVLDEFEKWKASVPTIGFGRSFQEPLHKVPETDRPCCRVDIPMNAGKIPERQKCPHCPRDMETYISFKCCHIDDAVNPSH